MTEDYSEPYTFQEALNTIMWASFANELPFPSWIRDNTPGHGLLVLSWTSISSMRQWFGYFNVRQHRADPPVWAWGWHGWTVLLSVLESGPGDLSEARSSVPGTDAATFDPDAAIGWDDPQTTDPDGLRRQGFAVADLERGAAVASALLDPDATITLPCVQATRQQPHGTHTRHCGGWADAPTEPQPAVNLWNHPQTGEIVVSQFPSVTA